MGVIVVSSQCSFYAPDRDGTHPVSLRQRFQHLFAVPSMPELFDQIQEALQFIRKQWKGTPSVGVVLGTGLGALAGEIQAEAILPYSDLPHFPKSTVMSHAGQLRLGKLGSKTVVAMEGRFHAYEGYS